jgi:hypothetical protein
MNNYLDLLATDCNSIDIQLTVEPIVNNGAPDLTVVINHRQHHQGTIHEPVCINTKMSLLQHLDIKLVVSNKIYSAQNETAVIVTSLLLDGQQLVNKFDIPITYNNDQNIKYSGFYLGFNGVWHLALDTPFYRWLHTATGQWWLLAPVEPAKI